MGSVGVSRTSWARWNSGRGRDGRELRGQRPVHRQYAGVGRGRLSRRRHAGTAVRSPSPGILCCHATAASSVCSGWLCRSLRRQGPCTAVPGGRSPGSDSTGARGGSWGLPASGRGCICTAQRREQIRSEAFPDDYFVEVDQQGAASPTGTACGGEQSSGQLLSGAGESVRETGQRSCSRHGVGLKIGPLNLHRHTSGGRTLHPARLRPEAHGVAQ